MSENANPESASDEQREKLRRERELLLTTFNPSEFDFPSDSGSFAALAEYVRQGDEPTDPSVGPVHPGEEPTT